MTRVYTVHAIGDGTSIANAVRPAVPSGTAGAFYLRDGQFLLATDADLTGVGGVVELTGADIDAACTSWGIDASVLI